jgi:hypothetical protein
MEYLACTEPRVTPHLAVHWHDGLSTESPSNALASPRVHLALKEFGRLSSKRRWSWFFPPLLAMIAKDFIFLVDMDSDDEMIQQIIDDKQDFDTDVSKHMSIIVCLKNS